MNKEFNPFNLSMYSSPDEFCDRREEIRLLKQFIQNGSDITIFAMRRLGKTGLIHHLFDQYKNSRKTVCIYVDILATQNLSEFTNQLATAIYNRLPPEKGLGQKILEFLKAFRPVISFDELSGNPSLKLGLETSAERQNTINQLFQFLDRQNKQIVFAIDEFQQILEYPEGNMENILRTYIQPLKNTNFIFSGSDQKMMHEIFNSAKRPFFASCSNIHLDYIEENEYKQFITHQFTKHKRTISTECVDFICNWTKLHTFYTQYFCHALYARNKKKIELQDAHKNAIDILKINENTFYQYRNLLTDAQWKLLCAFAKEERVYQPTSMSFIAKHNLGTPSLVKRGLDALVTKEMIYHNTGIEKPYFEVYNKFLIRWVQHKLK